MSYLVISHETSGLPTYREVEGLDEAARFVEQLRNDVGVEHARICRLEEVPFEFRPYYRVEVHDAAGDPDGADETDHADATPASAEVRQRALLAAVEPIDPVRAEHQRHGLFER